MMSSMEICVSRTTEHVELQSDEMNLVALIFQLIL